MDGQGQAHDREDNARANTDRQAGGQTDTATQTHTDRHTNTRKVKTKP